MPLRFKLVASLLVGMMECTLLGTGRAAESRRTIFVSATSGLDAKDGLSSQSPWLSLAKVNAAELRPGDRVLFKRGDTWRGQLVSQSGREGAPITYGAYGQGARPVLLGETHDVVIRNCDIAWIGGGHQLTGPDGKPVRFGNGIEFWENAHDNLVEGCRIWEIYDAALTNQGSRSNSQINITYRNNVIWNSEYSFEYWNCGPESTTRNIRFEHNTCVNAGFGWGHAQRPDPNGRHLMFYANTARTSEFSVRENIFYNATESCLRIDNDWTDGLSLDRNCWSQTTGVLMQFLRTQFVATQFTEYQKQARLDTHSIVADPKFVNRAALDFRLTEDSLPRNLGPACGPVGAVKRLEKQPGGMIVGADTMSGTQIGQIGVRKAFSVTDTFLLPLKR